VLYELCTGIAPHESRGPQAIVKFMSRCKRLALPDDASLLADAKAAAAQVAAAATASCTGSTGVDGETPTQPEGLLETSNSRGEHSMPSLPVGRLRVASGEALPSALHDLYLDLSLEEPEERPSAAEVVNQLERVIRASSSREEEQNNAGQSHDRIKNSDASSGCVGATTESDAATTAAAATNEKIAAAEAAADAATASAAAAERVYKAATHRANGAAVAAAARAAATAVEKDALRAQANRANLVAMASLAIGGCAVLWLWSFHCKVQRRRSS